MKRFLAVLLISVMLCGCSRENTAMQRGMELREKMLRSSCSFTADITADYGDRTYTFQMGCTADTEGNLKFVVLAPESIASITGEIRGGSGYLTFGETALAFPLLADGEVSPVSAPWLLAATLRGGYLASAGMEGENPHLTLYDSYQEDALQLDVLLNEQNAPMSCEILWQGRRVLSVCVKDFSFV